MCTFDFLLNQASGSGTLNDFLKHSALAIFLRSRLIIFIGLCELRLLQNGNPGALLNPGNELLSNSLEQRCSDSSLPLGQSPRNLSF